MSRFIKDNPYDPANPDPAKFSGERGLVKGERVLRNMKGESGLFVLTDMRVLFLGGRSDKNIFSASRLEHLISVRIELTTRLWRNLVWVFAGIVALIGLLQVSAAPLVMLITGGILGIGIIAVILDYVLRPNKNLLVFGTPGGSVEGVVKNVNSADVREFVAAVEDAKMARMDQARDDSGHLKAYHWTERDAP